MVMAGATAKKPPALAEEKAALAELVTRRGQLQSELVAVTLALRGIRESSADLDREKRLARVESKIRPSPQDEANAERLRSLSRAAIEKESGLLAEESDLSAALTEIGVQLERLAHRVGGEERRRMKEALAARRAEVDRQLVDAISEVYLRVEVLAGIEHGDRNWRNFLEQQCGLLLTADKLTARANELRAEILEGAK
jgi:hypothetical protein